MIKYEIQANNAKYTFNEDILKSPNQSFRGLLDVWRDVWLSEFRRSGFKYEDQIPLRFHLQMSNDKMLRLNNETYLKCTYKLKQVNIRREKNVTTDKSAFFEKWV